MPYENFTQPFSSPESRRIADLEKLVSDMKETLSKAMEFWEVNSQLTDRYFYKWQALQMENDRLRRAMREALTVDYETAVSIIDRALHGDESFKVDGAGNGV